MSYGSLKIIYIGDDTTKQEHLYRLLRESVRYQLVARWNFNEIELKMIRYCMPDVIIFDMDVPRIDCIHIIDELKHLGSKMPRMIVLASSLEQEFVDYMIRSGVHFYLPKPVRYEDFSETIKLAYCCKNNEKKAKLEHLYCNQEVYETILQETAGFDLRQKIQSTVIQSGVSPKLKAYEYLQFILLLLVEEDFRLHGGKLYEKTAIQFETTAYSVEKSIRTAISHVWDKNRQYFMEHFYGKKITMEQGKPSSLEFISLLRNYLKIEYFV